MSEFLTTNNDISDTQVVFPKKRNTTLAVSNLVVDPLKAFHNKTYCICIFIDLRKSFDTVDVEILVEKLKMCGIRGTGSLLINCYLSNRDQYVVYEDYESDVLPINVGVPQGSVLRFVLLLIFVFIKIHFIGCRILSNLGIVLDNKLSFKLHIADVPRRLSRIRGVIYSVAS